jgi:DNA topoisomerase I
VRTWTPSVLCGETKIFAGRLIEEPSRKDAMVGGRISPRGPRPRKAAAPPADSSEPLAAAKSAKLRYATDDEPGIRRAPSGKGFRYRGPDGKPLRAAEELRRIAALAVPPAWTGVWISPHPNAHLQATGRDARARKQYRYHPRWREARDETKYEHMRSFGAALPRIRRRVARDLERPGLPREKVLAAVIRLMERSLARIGNAEYARTNNSFGLTTLHNRHVRISGGRIELDFSAKSGLHHHSVISDRKLARILKRCRDLPGSELFQYVDEAGQRHRIASEDVNAYLRQISAQDVTAKDFRTWAATSLALFAIVKQAEIRPTKKQAAEVVRQVSQQLGNTPAVCRKCYIHPGLMAAWISGTFAESCGDLAKDVATRDQLEAALLQFLDRPELVNPSLSLRRAAASLTRRTRRVTKSIGPIATPS